MEMQGTTPVVDRLRSEGYRVTLSYVQWLLRDRIIPSPAKGPGNVLVWSLSDSARLRAELSRRDRGPST